MNNLPNKITIIRICLLPLVIFFYLADNIFGIWGKLVAFILFVTCCLTDMLDGHIARKYNLVTDFGKFLDPIADKLLATTGLVLLITGFDPVIPFIYGIVFIFVMLLRDYAVTGLRQLGQLKGYIIAADKVAKIKANFLYFTLIYGMMMSFIRGIDAIQKIENLLNILNIILYIFIGITIFLIALSGTVYIVNNMKVFKEDKKEEKSIEEKNS